MRLLVIQTLLLHLFVAYVLLSPASADNNIRASFPAGNKIAMSKTFPSKNDAEVFADKLKSEGFEVEIREVTSKNKDTFYRVSGKRHPESLKDTLSSSRVSDDEKISPAQSNEPGQGKPRSLVILSPRERAEFRNVNKITFLWRGVPQAVSYHVILAKDRTLTGVIEEEQNITGTSYTIEGLNYGTYFFKVRSRLSNNAEGPSSETLSFIIVPPKPSTQPLYFLESGSS
jgi:hypothetical protein